MEALFLMSEVPVCAAILAAVDLGASKTCVATAANPRPEPGLHCLMCSKFSRKRKVRSSLCWKSWLQLIYGVPQGDRQSSTPELRESRFRFWVLERKQLSPLQLHSPHVRFAEPASGRGTSKRWNSFLRAGGGDCAREQSRNGRGNGREGAGARKTK